MLLPSPTMVKMKYEDLRGKKVRRRLRPLQAGFPFA